MATNTLFFSIVKNNLELHRFSTRAVILDVGCGNGDVCQELLNSGFESVHGIDVEFKSGKNTERLKELGIIKKIDIGNSSRAEVNSESTYKWPRFKNKANVIITRAVLEHVFNLNEFVKSSKENLAGSGSICIHYFPSKYSLIESHVGVPLGAWISNRKYITIMCRFGLCFAKYKNRGSEAYVYLKKFTNYRSQSAIDEIFISNGFEKVSSVSPLRSHNSSYLRALSFFPFFDYIFALLRSRVVTYRLK